MIFQFVELTVTCWFLSRSQDKEIMKEIMDNGPVQGMDFSRIFCATLWVAKDKQSEVKHSANGGGENDSYSCHVLLVTTDVVNGHFGPKL